MKKKIKEEKVRNKECVHKLRECSICHLKKKKPKEEEK